jgi:hypothetical protein
MKIARNFARKKYCLSTVFVRCRAERCEIIPNPTHGGLFRRSENVFTGIHPMAFIMRASKSAARKSVAASERLTVT